MTTSSTRRGPSVADLAVGAGFVVLGQLVTWAQIDSPDSFDGSRPVNAVVNLIAMSCLAWRRAAPTAAVAAYVVVACLSHMAADLDATVLGTAVPLVVLTAAAGYHLSLRRSALALGIALAGLAALSSTTPYLRTPEAAIYNATMLLLPWVGARALRAREDDARRLGEALAWERAEQESRLAAGVAEERARIARELHDVVAHAVSVMVVQVGAARMQLARAPSQAGAALLDAEDAGRRALGDLRQLLGLLRSPSGAVEPASSAPQPGLARVDELVRQVRATGLDVVVDVSGTPQAVQPMLDLSAYRILQEALTNVLRHADARRATVFVEYGPAAVTLEVIDDGTPTVVRGGGHGLIGIRERAALFGGTAETGPHEAGGWRVRVTLPVPPTDGVRAPRVVEATG